MPLSMLAWDRRNVGRNETLGELDARKSRMLGGHGKWKILVMVIFLL